MKSGKRSVLDESTLVEGQYILKTRCGDVFHFQKSEIVDKSLLRMFSVARENDKTIFPNGVEVYIEDIVWYAKL